jgi:hypothetical protein
MVITYQMITAIIASAGPRFQNPQFVKCQALVVALNKESILFRLTGRDLKVCHSTWVYAKAAEVVKSVLVRMARPVPIRRNHCCWFSL